MLLRSEYWASYISFLLFLPSLFFQLAYIWLIFSLMLPLLNELKTSVSSRGAHLDYHCLLAQWMEVSISVTTAGLTEQTRNSKAALWLSLHQRSIQLLDMHCLVGFWERHFSGFFISNSTVHKTMSENPSVGFWLKLLTIHPVVCPHCDV